MSTWNYRVVHHVDRSPYVVDDDGEDVFFLIEAYYDNTETLYGWHPEVRPTGDSVEAVRADLRRMIEALDRPVIEETDLPNR